MRVLPIPVLGNEDKGGHEAHKTHDGGPSISWTLCGVVAEARARQHVHKTVSVPGCVAYSGGM